MQEAPRHLVFGGSFDPFHNGHLQLAQAAAERYRVDKVLLSLRLGGEGQGGQAAESHFQRRLDMLRRLVERHPWLAMIESDIEARPACTYDSLRLLARKDGIERPGFILGSDQFMRLHDWQSADKLLPLALWVVGLRRGGERQGRADCDAQRQRLERRGARVELLDADIEPLSSSAVRDRARAGEPLDELLPRPVADCIKEYGIY